MRSAMWDMRAAGGRAERPGQAGRGWGTAALDKQQSCSNGQRPDGHVYRMCACCSVCCTRAHARACAQARTRCACVSMCAHARVRTCAHACAMSVLCERVGREAAPEPPWPTGRGPSPAPASARPRPARPPQRPPPRLHGARAARGAWFTFCSAQAQGVVRGGRGNGGKRRSKASQQQRNKQLSGGGGGDGGRGGGRRRHRAHTQYVVKLPSGKLASV